MQQQFVSVTEARANLKQLIDTVVSGKARVVLVRESKPEVALVRYDDMVRQEEISEQEWQKRWDEALKEGRKAGRRWAKEQGIDLKKMTEEQLYDFIVTATIVTLRQSLKEMNTSLAGSLKSPVREPDHRKVREAAGRALGKKYH